MNSCIEPRAVATVGVTQWLSTPDGRRLAYTVVPAHKPWGHVLISHGFSEHRGWWCHVAQALAARGLTTHFFDHFHHGASDGLRGDLERFDEITEGLRLAGGTAGHAAQAEGLPMAVLCHSMGGLAFLRALPRVPQNQVAAVALCSPLLQMGWFNRVIGQTAIWLMGHKDPARRLPYRSSPSKLTANPAVWPEYAKDRFRFRQLSPRFFKGMRKAADETYRNILAKPVFPFPLLVLTGSRDRVVSLGAIQTWLKRVRTPALRRIHYQGMVHELFNEAAWKNVVDDLTGWLKTQMGPGAQAKAPGKSTPSRKRSSKPTSRATPKRR
ncbi:MAG: lysophospholipase [Deltaproteobacteria bacterium]|nr:lysophospholipase [Deltaproteobacteria bacterium]